MIRRPEAGCDAFFRHICLSQKDEKYFITTFLFLHNYLLYCEQM